MRRWSAPYAIIDPGTRWTKEDLVVEQAVRERAAKLQRLADDPAAAPGERANATAQLAELVARHGDLAAAPTRPAFADRRTYGAKARKTAELTSRQIVDLIKADIKAARRPAPRGTTAAAVPVPRNPICDAPRGVRFHVKCQINTGCAAIDITIGGVPIERAVDAPHGEGKRKLSKQCQTLVNALHGISFTCNWHGDGFMQDYADCRYFSQIRIRTTNGDVLPT
ncbi:hypothetical protein ACI1MP_37535 (plasmid) [Kitasatospora griseola]|uniref:hypothetical protein n=1 Tax=Kitasatospora griseola TaxID=2064 RepID=UPI003855A7F9